MEDFTVVNRKGLKKLGIEYSPTHITRLMKAQPPKFPLSFKLQDDTKARKVWWLEEIKAWLLERSKRR